MNSTNSFRLFYPGRQEKLVVHICCGAACSLQTDRARAESLISFCDIVYSPVNHY